MTKKKEIQKHGRYSLEYERMLDLMLLGIGGSLISGITCAIRPFISKIIGAGLLGLIFECEQECEEEFFTGISEFSDSEDLNLAIKPIMTAMSGKEVTNQECSVYYYLYKKWFT